MAEERGTGWPNARREDAVVFAQWRRANVAWTRGADESLGR